MVCPNTAVNREACLVSSLQKKWIFYNYVCTKPSDSCKIHENLRKWSTVGKLLGILSEFCIFIGANLSLSFWQLVYTMYFSEINIWSLAPSQYVWQLIELKSYESRYYLSNKGKGRSNYETITTILTEITLANQSIQ